MRHKVIISAISAIAVAAIVGALVVKHRFPFEAAGATQPPAQAQQRSAAITSDEAQTEWAQTHRSYPQVTSPSAGVTGIRQTALGNITHPPDPNGLVVVTQVEPISVIFTLPETSLAQIQE